MDFKTAKMILGKMPSNVTVMLKGVHGVGKTECIREISETMWHLKCIEFQASQISDVGDLIGLQRYDESTQQTVWALPYWFNKDEPVCLFLDELNRGTPLITNALMQLALEHRILNFKLPEGSRVVVAINPSEDGRYDVEEFDPAKLDRFAVMEFKPTVSEWLEYARKSNHQDLIVDYISIHEEDLDPYSAKENSKTTGKGSFDGILPSRRSWTLLSRAMDAYKDDYWTGDDLNTLVELASMFVGRTVATKLKLFASSVKKGLTSKMIMETDNFEIEILPKLKAMNQEGASNSSKLVDMVNLGKSVIDLLNFKDEMTNEVALKYSNNFYGFLKALPPEARAQIYRNGVSEARSEKRPWVGFLTKANKKLSALYMEIVKGITAEK